MAQTIAAPRTRVVMGAVVSRGLRVAVVNVLPLVGLLAAWEALARSELMPRALFPSVSETASRLVELAQDGVLPRDILWSLGRLLLSGFLSIVLGTLFGVAMGMSRILERVLVPPLYFFLSIPGIALFPIAILWFGLSETTLIVVLTFEATITIIINAWTGVKTVDRILLMAGRSMGADGPSIMWRVMLPGALPSLIAGYRIAFSRIWRILVAGEMLASIGAGLGYRIFEARTFMASDVMYAGVLVIGILGFLLERVLLRSLELYTVERWGVLHG